MYVQAAKRLTNLSPSCYSTSQPMYLPCLLDKGNSARELSGYLPVFCSPATLFSVSSSPSTPGDSPVFLSASQDQHVHLWGIPSGGDQGCVALLHQCKGHARSVEGIAVSPDHTKVGEIRFESSMGSVAY